MKSQGIQKENLRSLKALPCFFSSSRGVVAVEFAFIAPILIIFFFGIVEFSRAYMVRSKASTAASSVGDLIAQSPKDLLSKDDMEDIFFAGQSLMEPYPTNKKNLNIVVTSVKMERDSRDSTKTNVLMISGWVNKTAPFAARIRAKPKKPLPASPDFVPEELVEAGANLIVVESRYTYPAFLNFFIKKDLTFSDKYYYSPRYGHPIRFESPY